MYESQHFIREINQNERSVVSLRDVARASRVFRWFLKHYTKWSVTERNKRKAEREANQAEAMARTSSGGPLTPTASVTGGAGLMMGGVTTVVAGSQPATSPTSAAGA